MPHIDYSRPHRERRVLITYRNMPVSHHVSHIGLGVSAVNIAKSLRAAGIAADVMPILSAKQLAQIIRSSPHRPSHVVIAAPWIPTLDLQADLVFKPEFSDIQFAVTCHSNVGFLTNDPMAIHNFREDLDLEQGALNFRAAGNSKRFCHWVKAAYKQDCLWLPNLYYLDPNARPVQRPPWQGGTLFTGSYGAIRPLKNHLSAAAAVLELAHSLNCRVEFDINVGRNEGGNTVIRSIRELLNDHPAVKLRELGWFQWPRFRKEITHRHICFQVSYTESFNMVSADAASVAVTSVVSDAIDWASRYARATPDDAIDIARVAQRLLFNPLSGIEAYESLVEHNAKGLVAWMQWIELA